MSEQGARRTGRLVRASRQKAGLTQRQLAGAAGVSVSVVRDLEQGRTARPHEESLRRLASALRLSLQQATELSLAARETVVSPTGPQRGQAAGLRIGVLGPLMAWRRDVPVVVGSPMQRAVLGLLALDPGTGLPRSAIIDALWGGDPPMTAVSMVQTYISRLRRSLWPCGPVGTAGKGYRLEPVTCELDLRTFGALARHAQQAQAAGELTAACQAYADALALWRGDPLADCEVLRGHPAVVRLGQQWVDTVTAYAEAAIAARCPNRILPQLRELTDREPLNERAHALLMIALAGSGQQAAALGIFDQMRRRLDHELGLRPGAELTAAQAQVLNQRIPGGPVLGGAAPVAMGATRPRPADREAPGQLPCAVAHFTGRAVELAALNATLNQPAGQAIVISAIAGTAGAGKTALAIQWAHQVAGCFPDGQLYVNLRGYDRDQPMPAADALAGFLRALGVPGRDIPPEEDERAARYRSLLGGKRMLVVLDNAGSADQVRPLLPASPACTVVVTSRDALAGLVARDGATRLDLDLLPPEDAVGLLRALIGARVDAAPDAAAELAGQCCRLPLALRVVAELAASRPGVPLAELTSELADLNKRLDLLTAGGDRRTAVRAVFSWSYQHLGTDAARAFRLLGLHPGPGFGPWAAAALTGKTAEQTRQTLDTLARAHLIHITSPGRYGLHDLLRAYAWELSGGCDRAERREGLTRLFDYYLYTAASAMDTLYPAERHRRPRIPPPASSCPAVAGMAAARTWLDTERSTLAAVAAYTAACGWPDHAIRLAATVFRYLEAGGYYPEIIAIHDHARRAARATGDRTAEMEALRGLIVTDLRQGRHQQAADRLRQALAVYRETGNQAGEAQTLCNLGIAALLQGHYEQAVSYLQRALAVHRQIDDQVGEARTLGNLSLVELRLGNYRQASQHLRQALAICSETGDRVSEAYALSNLGVLQARLGNHQQARGDLDRALAVCRETGDRACEAYALGNLGVVESRLGDHRQASEDLDRALAISRENGDRASEAEALNSLGEVLLAAGRPDDARAQQAIALGIASQIDDKYERARAHSGLARCHFAAGAADRARHHWKLALTLYAALGVPEADQVRAQLATPASQDNAGL
jgi:tetratricopeptide (TPR) repeat protein/DNA-binding SARP family transcriptional activator/DNA-binding XRE family transcriptional regulator